MATAPSTPCTSVCHGNLEDVSDVATATSTPDAADSAEICLPILPAVDSVLCAINNRELHVYSQHELAGVIDDSAHLTAPSKASHLSAMEMSKVPEEPVRIADLEREVAQLKVANAEDECKFQVCLQSSMRFANCVRERTTVVLCGTQCVLPLQFCNNA